MYPEKKLSTQKSIVMFLGTLGSVGKYGKFIIIYRLFDITTVPFE